jgi:hypothetical protein
MTIDYLSHFIICSVDIIGLLGFWFIDVEIICVVMSVHVLMCIYF